MDYSEAREAFFQPRPGEARDLGYDSPARRLRDAIEPLATICFWSEPAYDAYAARGLDFLQGYVWGRTSALGEPEPSLAAAAFGVFEPGLVADLYVAGRSTCSLAEVRTAKLEGSTAALREVLGEAPEGLHETLAVLQRAVDAASPLGRPFFAALTGHDSPDDPIGRLWHLCTMLRELRGDGHLAVVAAEGFDGVEANQLTELWVGWDPLAYTGSRAWSPEAMSAGTGSLERRGLVAGGALTDEGRALRERIEAATDRSVQPAIDAIGSDLDALVTRLDGWSARVVEHGWFPPDPYKRASG